MTEGIVTCSFFLANIFEPSKEGMFDEGNDSKEMSPSMSSLSSLMKLEEVLCMIWAFDIASVD